MNEYEVLAARISQLENKHRRFRDRYFLAATLAVIALLLGAVVANQDDLQVNNITAQRIVIADEDGRERLVLELDAGEPTLTMRNHDGVQQIYLGIDENWDDSAYLSVCSRRENGAVSKQATLVATSSRESGAGLNDAPLPGNAQLVLYDANPQHAETSGQHLMRFSSGYLSIKKPYVEIRDLPDSGDRELNFDLLTSGPEASGQRFLIDSTPTPAIVR